MTSVTFKYSESGYSRNLELLICPFQKRAGLEKKSIISTNSNEVLASQQAFGSDPNYVMEGVFAEPNK